MAKTIPSTLHYRRVPSQKRVTAAILPGSDEVTHHDADTFDRLKKAGCVKEAPETDDDGGAGDNGSPPIITARR